MITPEHFLDRPYRIPNHEEIKDFQKFINFWEKKTLLALMGVTLYDLMVAGLAVGSPAQKWIDLRDGAIYNYGGVSYRFEGLIKMLQPQIYSKWIRENFDKLTKVGPTRPALDEDVYLNPARRIVQSQNEFARRAGNCILTEDSLYGFLQTNYATYVTNYSDWQFIDPGFENRIGI